MIRRLIPTTGLIALLLTLSGCIEFEKQTILVHLDRKADVVHARLIYEGIYATGDVHKEFKELDTVAKRGTRFFLLDNWPLEFDVGDPPEGAKLALKNSLIRPFVKVTNGRFYRNEEGRLSAWQDLKIEKASKFFATLNRGFSLAVLTGQVRELRSSDARTKMLSKMAALANHEWVRIDEEGVLDFRFFASEADAMKFKRYAFGRLPSAPETDAKEGAKVVVMAGPAKADPKKADPEKADPEKAAPAKGAPEEGDGAKGAETKAQPVELTDREATLRFLSENSLSWSQRRTKLSINLSPDRDGILRLKNWNSGTYKPNLLEPDPATGKKPPELPLALDKTVKTAALITSFETDAKKRGSSGDEKTDR